jgi:hypothetical protein
MARSARELAAVPVDSRLVELVSYYNRTCVRHSAVTGWLALSHLAAAREQLRDVDLPTLGRDELLELLTAL